jgi:hypothetical protein
LSCAGLLGTVVARAQQVPEASVAPEVTPEATRFEFHAPDGCSSAEDFSARVRRRSARIRLVTDAAAQRSLVVEIQQPGPTGALRGTVKVVEPDGATRTRQLKAASCEEAVEGLSLIATVTLDPDALLGEPQPEPKPAPPAPKPAPPKPPPAPPPPPTSRRGSYRFSFGLEASALLHVAPEPAFGGSVFAAFELQPGSLFATFVRLSVTHAERRGVEAPGGQAGFAYTLPALDLCPVRLGPKALALRPCGFVSAGVLEVWGNGTPFDETHQRFYGAAGAALLAQLRLSEAVEIVADGHALLPFRRDEYGFDGVRFFTTPTPGFSTGVGVAGGFQ